MADYEHYPPITVEEPFPVACVGGHYLIHDINTITHVRRVHNICGVLIGTLPRIPQQNVFLGVPLHLMPEEARVLVEKGAAFIVDDTEVHSTAMSRVSDSEKQAFRHDLERDGRTAAHDAETRMANRKEKALKRIGRLPQGKPSDVSRDGDEGEVDVDLEEDDTTLFSSPAAPTSTTDSTSSSALIPYPITPTLSHPPLPPATPNPDIQLPSVPRNSYPLYAHLHSKGYFMTPGLRFGCQYSVYPGDPLRFHSHFLAIGASWDEPLDLLGLVGGGRLGTGVKKGFLIGGQQESPPPSSCQSEPQLPKVRTFCIEWASM